MPVWSPGQPPEQLCEHLGSQLEDLLLPARTQRKGHGMEKTAELQNHMLGELSSPEYQGVSPASDESQTESLIEYALGRSCGHIFSHRHT